MRILLTCVFTLMIGGSAEAASLSVSPISLDVVAPASAAKITVRNQDTRPLVVQFRAFRWTQNAKGNTLEPTREVVASPPISKIQPGSEQVVRIVRVATAPVTGEESYRLLVDEVPNARRAQNGTVTLVLRYSIPVFFASQDARPPRVTWRINAGTPLSLSAHNAGDKHMRIANLSLVGTNGEPTPLAKGLVGYVLGGSSTRFSFAQTPLPTVTGREAKLLGDSQEGPFDAAVIYGDNH